MTGGTFAHATIERKSGLTEAEIEREREFVALDHVRFLGHCALGGGKSLLDIGCGSGTFLHLAQRRAFLPHGMDVSPHAVAAALVGLAVRESAIDFAGPIPFPALRGALRDAASAAATAFRQHVRQLPTLVERFMGVFQ